MGETIDNKDFAVKEDGTIVRNRKCSKCGKESFSNGDYCEYCGHKLPKVKPRNLNYERVPNKWMIVLMVIGTLFFGILGICIGYYCTGVVEDDGVLHYRFNKKTRRWGMVAMVVSLLSWLFWSAKI